MSQNIRTYTGEDIDVTYDAPRCIHAAECIRHLPQVFDTRKRPWVQPDNAAADVVAAVVERCPTGALHTIRRTGDQEAPAATNTVQLRLNGPLYVRGDLEVLRPDGSTVVHDTRLALCRCGASHNKPFCDNSHRQARFSAPDVLPVSTAETAGTTPEGLLRITLQTNGPLLFEGPLSVVDGHGDVAFEATPVLFCRCGGSGNKPFCDDTHTRNGFSDS